MYQNAKTRFIMPGDKSGSAEYSLSLPHIEIPDHPLTWMLDQTARRYPDHTTTVSLSQEHLS